MSKERVCLEVLTSERTFVRDVSVFLEGFSRPLQIHSRRRGTACVTTTEANVLDCGMEKILHVSKLFLRRLEDDLGGGGGHASSFAQAEAGLVMTPTNTPRSVVAKAVGNAFVANAERMLQAYVAFVMAYPDSFAMYQTLMDEKKRVGAPCKFSDFVSECASRDVNRVRGRTIMEFLILPVQRIPRYKLLLQELLKRLTLQSEIDLIKHAISCVSEIAIEMNYRLGRSPKPRKRRSIPVQQFEMEEEELAAKHPLALKQINMPLPSSSPVARPQRLFGSPSIANSEDVRNSFDSLAAVDNGKIFTIQDTEDDDISKQTSSPSKTMVPHVMAALARSASLTTRATSPVVTSPKLFRNPASPSRTTPIEPLTEEVELKNWMEGRRWTVGHSKIPTSNVSVLVALRIRGSPWTMFSEDHDHNGIDSFEPERLTGMLLNGLYRSPRLAELFRPRKNDIIVTGPIRSGQTAVLHLLSCLRARAVVPLTRLADVVTWVDHEQKPPPQHDAMAASHFLSNAVRAPLWRKYLDINTTLAGRIIKTHSTMTQLLGPGFTPNPVASRPEWRIVLTLRHPRDLRVSFFRHLRRMFRKLSPPSAAVEFDTRVVPDDFINKTCMSAYPSICVEEFIKDAIRLGCFTSRSSPQICIVFYEQLLSNPTLVVKKLADFMGVELFSNELMEITEGVLTSSLLFPGKANAGCGGNDDKVGSTNVKFLASKDTMKKLDAVWFNAVNANKSSSYEKLYCASTSEDQYPFETTRSKSSVLDSRGAGSTKMTIEGGRSAGSNKMVIEGGRRTGSTKMTIEGGHDAGSTKMVIEGGRSSGSTKMAIEAPHVNGDALRRSRGRSLFRAGSFVTGSSKTSTLLVKKKSGVTEINDANSPEFVRSGSFITRLLPGASRTSNMSDASFNSAASRSYKTNRTVDPDDSDDEN